MKQAGATEALKQVHSFAVSRFSAAGVPGLLVHHCILPLSPALETWEFSKFT